MENYLSYRLLSFLAGFLLDLWIGDPGFSWHPICLIGKLIAALDKRLRPGRKTKQGEILAGLCLVFLVLGITGAVMVFILAVAYRLHWILGIVTASICNYFILATKSLAVESKKVHTALERQGLEAGRKAVSMIVGRDTANLTEEGVVKATVETVAENLSDGVIAPMLFICLGGPVAGMLYKAANTMDSMVGYKNDTYLYFGRVAAHLDDVLNFLPSRISAGLMILATFFTGMDTKHAVKIFLRDRKNHSSPNSAQTEAVMAGALNVQLAGDAWYFGKLYKKKTIGDSLRKIEPEDILRADRLLYATAVLSVVILTGVQVAFILIKGTVL